MHKAQVRDYKHFLGLIGYSGYVIRNVNPSGPPGDPPVDVLQGLTQLVHVIPDFILR